MQMESGGRGENMQLPPFERGQVRNERKNAGGYPQALFYKFRQIFL